MRSLHWRERPNAFVGRNIVETPETSGKATNTLSLVSTALLGLVAWLLNHPYVGMDIHDAKLYAVLAAHWLQPAAYARDPFFIFGSQDDFTLFSPLYGVLISWFGLDIAAQLVVIAGATLLAVAVALMSEKLFASYWARVLAVMLCAAAAYAYSPTNLSFRVNEEFATARALAVPLALLAIAFSLRGRQITGFATGILATLIHPLMGIWSILLLISVKLSDRTLLLLLSTGTACAAGASLAGFAPLQPLDPAWDTLMRPLSVVYVGIPHIQQLSLILFWFALLLLAGRFGNPVFRRWYQVVALLGITGLWFAQLASYFYPVKLVLQVQLWRAVWLVVFFALLAATELLEVAARRGKRTLLWLALGVVLLYLAHDLAGFLLLAGWAAAQSATVRRFASTVDGHPGASLRSLVILLALLIAAALPSYLLDIEQLGNALPASIDMIPAALRGAFIAGGLGLGFMAIASLFAGLARKNWLLPVLAVLLPATGLYWDQRSQPMHVWESRLLEKNAAGDIGKYIRRGEAVYWHDNSPMRTWFEIGTASYASGVQPAGSIFSREKTFEMKRRMERVAIASNIDAMPASRADEQKILARLLNGRPDAHGAMGNIFTAGAGTNPTEPGIVFLCQDPLLDWVVSPTRYTIGGLNPIGTLDPQIGRALFLYRCRQA